jgi:hypothetical protein|tara:strand:- start:2720 stop:3037 length:318 start_codon:yes stop_codon:yes gene_type:complete
MKKLLLTTCTVLATSAFAVNAAAENKAHEDMHKGDKNFIEKGWDKTKKMWNSGEEKAKEAGDYIEDKTTTSPAEKAGNKLEDAADSVSNGIEDAEDEVNEYRHNY